MAQRRRTRVRDWAWESLGADDRISRLPDCVIHHIFSFMDTRFVAQTSILSSRWRDIWKMHPRLSFKTDRSINRTGNPRFSSFVHRYLSNRDNAVEVSVFDVRLTSVKLTLLKEMIIYAMSHKTQKLNIEFLREKSTRRGGFDLSIFRSQIVQRLCLDIDFVVLKTPNLMWDLPALTTLKLQGAKFTLQSSDDGESKSLELFSCLKNLKTLVLVGCKLFNIDNFIIMSKSLENLVMIELNPRCEFVISAPKLSSFTYFGLAPFSLSANNLGSLETLKFCILYDRTLRKRPELVELMFKTFHQLRKTKFLTVNTDVLRFLSEFPKLLERQYCPFRRLQCLTVLRSSSAPCTPSYANVLTYFHESSPNLKANYGYGRAPYYN